MAAVSLFAFILAALLGLTMAWMHFQGKKSGMAIGIAHGLAALSGIALLTTGLVMREAGPAWWMLASFAVVAAGGAYLFSRQVRDEPWPAAVIVAHGGLALITLVALGIWIGTRGAPAADNPQAVSSAEVAPAPNAGL